MKSFEQELIRRFADREEYEWKPDDYIKVISDQKTLPGLIDVVAEWVEECQLDKNKAAAYILKILMRPKK